VNNKIVLGQYFHGNSWIHHLDPRIKIIIIFLLMTGIFLIEDFLILGIVIVLGLIVIATSKVPFKRFLKSLKQISILLVFTFVFQILFNKQGTLIINQTMNVNIYNMTILGLMLLTFIILYPHLPKKGLIFLMIIGVFFFYQIYDLNVDPVWTYQFEVYEKGLSVAAFVVIRIFILILISSLLTLTTKPTDLNNGLEAVLSPFEKIGIKTSILAMMIAIALRFIPTLLNEAYKILKAQASRGVDFKEGKLKDKVVQIVSLLIPMFIISFKRAEDLSDAMEARGYIPGEKRTKLNEMKMKLSDYISLCVVLASITVLVVLRIVS
jgi:energy-coupling factor transport system permease protein